VAAPPAYAAPIKRRYWGELMNITGMVFTNIWKRFWRVFLFAGLLVAFTLGKALYWPPENFFMLIPAIFVVSLLQTAFGRGRKFIVMMTILMSSVLFVGLISYPVREAIAFIDDYEPQDTVTDGTPDVMYLKRNVNLRSEPNMNAQVVEVMYEYNKIAYLHERQSNWVKVNYYGTVGWMYVDTDFYSATPLNPACKLAYGKDDINMRLEPSMEGSVIRQVNDFETLTYLETSLDGKWGYVRDGNGNTGWIWRSYLQVI